MSTMTRSNAETSVTFSLAELAKIEEERVREEDVKRARSRERDAVERREAEARRRAAEEAQIAAEAEARTRRLREDAIEKARIEARERAAIDVARIEAEAKARLDADNAARAHELAILRTRTEGGRRRLTTALAAGLAITLFGSVAMGYQMTRHAAALEQDTVELREGQKALGQERDHARTTALAALDHRHAALLARPFAAEAKDARTTVEQARHAVDEKALDHDRLSAFGDALDVLEARIDTLGKLSALDKRRDDLAAWAAERRRPEAAADARAAGTKARLMGTSEAAGAYEAALDKLRDLLAKDAGGKGGAVIPHDKDVVKRVCKDGDPGCGLNGESVF
jgi:hypothetical protein